MIATPSAPPTSRVVSLTAEPTPALSRGSEPMIDSVAGATASPMPPPISSIAMAMRPYPLVTVDVDATTRPAAKSSMPVTTTRLVPSRSTSFDDDGASDHHRDRERQRAHTGLERRVAEHELQVLRREEDEPEQGEEHERDGGARGGEARVLEEAHLEHRLRDPPLPPHEEGQGGTPRSRTRRRSWCSSSPCSAPR